MKKRLRITSFVLALLTAMTIFAGVALAAANGKVKTATKGSSVTLRTSASTTSKSLGSIKDGTSIEIVSKTKTGDWYKVKYSNKTGYLKKEFVTITSSGSTTKTSTSSSAKNGTGATTGTVSKAAYVYASSKTTSKKVASVKAKEKVTLISQTSSFFKVKTAKGKTGYILQKYVTPDVAYKVDDSRAGDSKGVYKNSTIQKPGATQSTQLEVWGAISYNLSNYETAFSLKINNYNQDMIPKRMSDVEYAYVEGSIEISDPKKLADGTTQLDFKVNYNEAGRIIKAYKEGKALEASDTKAIELKKVVDKVVGPLEKKTDYAKIVAIHDYVVKNAQYDNSTPPPQGTYYAYGVLTNGMATCQGYAESVGLLATVAGLENRIVWANSKMNEGLGTHGFNKVKVSEKWYNVDATVDDPFPETAGRIRRDFLLVTDKISKQRYEWDTTRYPASSTNNSWHARNKLVAKSQSELETIVKAGVAKKQKFVSVWVDSYTASKFKTGFAKSLSGVSGTKVSITGAHKSYSTFGTAILFQITYK